MASYPWCSYGECLGRGLRLLDAEGREFVLGVFGGLDAFRDFHSSAGEGARAIEAPWAKAGRVVNTDEEALRMAREVLGGVEVYDLKSQPKAERDRLLCRLRESGLSIRQIARITGIGRGIVSRAASESVET